MLDLQKATLTIDAAGCQKKMTAKIIDKGGNYVLAIKGKQGKLHDEVNNFFKEVSPEEVNCDYYYNEEKSRERIEKREVWSTGILEWLPQQEEWGGLLSIACLRSTRRVENKESVELRYYISSLKSDALFLGQAIRSHWQLDVYYREYACKIRKDHGLENCSVLRRATLNLLKGDKKTKTGIKTKRVKAGWNKKYMMEILMSGCQ